MPLKQRNQTWEIEEYDAPGIIFNYDRFNSYFNNCL